ncbi:TPA: membrane protein insertion efficiency factor YidD [Patescibacteria group bacterium]|nr:membrane protein insertion efficiency factor YidD [Patescibacteria group bacterium]
MQSLLAQVALKLVKLYQNSLSLDHGWLRQAYPYGYCRFYPSCSEYAYESIQKHGLIKGGWSAAKRLFRCHPYHPGGVDLVK